MPPLQQRTRRNLQTGWLYAKAILKQFRVSLLTLLLAVLIGGALHYIAPQPLPEPREGTPSQVLMSLYSAWMALLAEPVRNPPPTWYLGIVNAVYPLLGFALLGESLYRLVILIVSREKGEKEWMKVMASTYRDHIVLCGLGHLGYRILQQLLASGAKVVAIEGDASGRFLAEAKATGAPILVRDVREDQALIDAGVPDARTIIIATNDDMANLEVAMDARRMNPNVRIIMRMFDQGIADKIRDAAFIDEAFSPPALAAPLVAAMAHDTGVLSSFQMAGVGYVTGSVDIHLGSSLVGRAVSAIEKDYNVRVLLMGDERAAHPPANASAPLHAGSRIVVHAERDKLSPLVLAARSPSEAKSVYPGSRYSTVPRA